MKMAQRCDPRIGHKVAAPGLVAIPYRAFASSTALCWLWEKVTEARLSPLGEILHDRSRTQCPVVALR